MSAIQYARCRWISRKGGGSATRSAAYNMRGQIKDEQSKQLHRFLEDKNLGPDDPNYRLKPVHHAVLLPEGAPAAYARESTLWNAAERAERRINSQVAREVILALPRDSEVSVEDWKVMATTFAEMHFRDKGLAVQVDIHHDKPLNPHAHLLATTRYVTPEGFGAKARDLHPEVRRIGGSRRVTEGDQWGELWRAHQNAYFESRGYELRVDPVALVQRERLNRRERNDDAIKAAQAENRRLNAEATRDPAQVLAALTRHGCTFTERDLDRFLAKHLPDAAERIVVKAQVLVVAARTSEHLARQEELRLAALRPWMLKGGADALDRFDADAAWRSYSRWAERKPEGAAKLSFEAYVEFVQKRWAAHPEDRGALVKRANENANPRQRERPHAPGRINARLDSRYNRGGGHYDDEDSRGRRM